MPRINSSFTARIRNPGKDSLLEYLSRRFTYHSQAEWLELLALGRLQLEGASACGSEHLKEGQSLRFAVVDYDEPDVPLDFRILERSHDLCLVHKPAGMPVHRTGKIFFQTLANLIREQLQDTAWAPLNRLDRETSGLMAFAHGPEAFREHAPSAPEIHWVKYYAAVVRGTLAEATGTIRLPLGETGLGPIRSQVSVLAGGKPSLTLYQVVKEQAGSSLVVLAPITGRKHQIRAHMAALGAPLIGDKIYSLDGHAYLKQLEGDLEAADYLALGAHHHLLHAFHLRLEKSGSVALSGWDWDFGPEFSRYYNADLIRNWCAVTAFQDMETKVEKARTDFKSTVK